MAKTRLEAFSDGVIAIIITIMVLEMKVPEGGSLASLQPVVPVLLSYILSFVYLGIYWNNHHHMLHASRRVTGSVLWANLHLLFWLSLVPFTTGWMGSNDFSEVPAAVYGVVLLMAAIAYYILQQRLIATHGKDSVLRKAIGTDWRARPRRSSTSRRSDWPSCLRCSRSRSMSSSPSSGSCLTGASNARSRMKPEAGRDTATFGEHRSELRRNT